MSSNLQQLQVVSKALDENAETTSQPTSQHHADEYDVASEASGHTQLSLKRNSALFLLKTKEKGRVSQLLLDELVSDLTTFIQDRILKVKQGVDLIIKNSCPEMSIETKDAIERCFNKEEITKHLLDWSLAICRRSISRKR